MESFVLKGEEKPVFVPDVTLDADTGKCIIEGESYLEEPFQLYESVLKWMKNYFAEGKKQAELSIKLTYINSTSSRALLELFRGFSILQEQGKKLTVNWMYPSGNEDYNDIHDEGVDFMEESGVRMNFVSY